jgi:hypothetical protein
MTCGTCKHWGGPGEQGEAFHSCKALVFDSRHLIKYSFMDELDPADPGDAEDIAERDAFKASHRAVLQGEMASVTALMTREDFGCVLHEPVTSAVDSTKA